MCVCVCVSFWVYVFDMSWLWTAHLESGLQFRALYFKFGRSRRAGWPVGGWVGWGTCVVIHAVLCIQGAFI